ncbi:hypothetical protein EVAR_54136_1 [Eumeta japonica]|uniref:Uncharacterized protein n=1 Tax=Eumeta variegata TaxID=151549 RepID=A0A4C1Z176_EUMVA|nr:hypothetical protein EVAR_54136_1 [Eumeta japonica]
MRQVIRGLLEFVFAWGIGAAVVINTTCVRQVSGKSVTGLGFDGCGGTSARAVDQQHGQEPQAQQQQAAATGDAVREGSTHLRLDNDACVEMKVRFQGEAFSAFVVRWARNMAAARKRQHFLLKNSYTNIQTQKKSFIYFLNLRIEFTGQGVDRGVCRNAIEVTAS